MKGKNNRKIVQKYTENKGGESTLHSPDQSGTLADVSRQGIGRLLRRANGRSRALDVTRGNGGECSKNTAGSDLKRNDGRNMDMLFPRSSNVKVSREDSPEKGVVEESVEYFVSDDAIGEMDDVDWEDGSLPTMSSNDILKEDSIKGVTVELSSPAGDKRRKPVRRYSAEDKELAELVHKVHLLCLLARGRLIDEACDDPLIQAAMLSLVPQHLLRISCTQNLAANALSPLVDWFHNNFQVRRSTEMKKSFRSALLDALETHEGTPEEVAALSVALFRALNLTTRFVSILHVASLKPDADKSEYSSPLTMREGKGIFSSSTLMVTRKKQLSGFLESSAHNGKVVACERLLKEPRESMDGCSSGSSSHMKNSPTADKQKEKISNSSGCEARHDITGPSTSKTSQVQKRKGDIEFEIQLEMALSATAAGSKENKRESEMKSANNDVSNATSPSKKLKQSNGESSTFCHEISTAIGSRKIGSPLYWAEVFCSAESMTGRWVHVDAVNAIVDGEQKVEAASAACKTPLRYVVAFAGRGAKDVTRRYCAKWYKIASERITSVWWDSVLAPLKQLESGATGDMVHTKNIGKSVDIIENNLVPTRSSLEDMELETRALTEPLPTNQQAYKNHHLYAIERWLSKNQILHPKGPILGFCSGHPVYPRSCVQTLKTREKWLREGLQVKKSELPAKVLKRSTKLRKVQFSGDAEKFEINSEGTVELFGKWQAEPLCLPPAVDGIVPKNERGRVDVWSEKCLPPGTVHIRLPYLSAVARRLEIDYAPAMVGFEFRSGRSYPVFDGIVVCTEFKDAILEAYAEEKERREAEEKKRNESQAIARWYQLLSSIVTRQRLNNRYGDASSTKLSSDNYTNRNELHTGTGATQEKQSLQYQEERPSISLDTLPMDPTSDHEHVFVTEDQSSNDGCVVTKRCHCGFMIQVEEL